MENSTRKCFLVALKRGLTSFGGGHVVLPLLESGTVNAWLVTKDAFFAGYGAAQAAIKGANATVVGLLASALLGIFITRSIGGVMEWGFLGLLFLVIYRNMAPVWLVVMISAVVGGFFF